MENNNKSRGKKIIALLLCLVLIGVSLFLAFKKNNVIRWDDSMYDDLMFIMPANIELSVSNLKDIDVDEISYTSTCGKINSDGLKVNWDLTDADGKCSITAKYRNDKIEKNIVVLNLYGDNELKMDVIDINYDSDEDIDYDGLTNKQEKEYNTNPQLMDTDIDGLDDYYEIFNSKTDPNLCDTDKDGINDYDEIKLNLNPNKADTLDDGIEDGKRTLTYNYEAEDIKITLKGKGNIATVAANTYTNRISDKKGLINRLYSLATDGTLDEATVTIPYTPEDLANYNLKEDNLSIYYYNVSESKYEKINTIVDKANKTVTAKLNHFSNYVVGDSSVVSEQSVVNVLFILDNSWSLYSIEQYEKITGKTISEADKSKLGYDVNGKRFEVTKNLVERFADKNYKVGLAEFRNDYAKVASIGSDKNTVLGVLNNMNGNFKTNTEGTNIGNALTRGIKEFTNKKDNNYIIILTDGLDNTLSSRKNNIINSAKTNNVKICSVGFGEGIENKTLNEISSATGCDYLSGGNAQSLDELFNRAGTVVDNDLVDINNDKIPDGILIADSGFIVNRDGFSFHNYSSNITSGHCYGMATIAELYYRNVLPLKNGEKVVEKRMKQSGEYAYWPSYAYDLNDVANFNSHNSLYSYHLQTDAFKYDSHIGVGNTNYVSLYEIKDNKLVYKDAIREEINSYSLYDIILEEPTLSKADQIKKYGFSYDKYETVLINYEKMQNSNKVGKGNVMLLNAILQGYIKQDKDVYYASSSNFTSWIRDVVGNDPIEYTGSNAFLTILVGRLNDKDPLLLKIQNGHHAVNAIDLIQDINDQSIFHIGVYDSNYPGSKRYIDIKCNEKECYTVKNNYYSDDKLPILITLSLESDLKYFN